MSRSRIYYPKSHILTNLHTSGKEWMLQDGTEYIGFYHKYIDGILMTESVFNPSLSKKLIPYINTIDQPDNFLYNQLINKKNVARPAPHYTFCRPIDTDFAAGKIDRYFIRRRNLTTFEDIMEIDLVQFKLWKKAGEGIDETLYNAIPVSWKLTGPIYDIIQSPNTIYGVYNTNNRIVNLKDKELPGLKDFLTDYIELSVHSPLTSQKVKEMFGTK
jgi:hypothetical protein